MPDGMLIVQKPRGLTSHDIVDGIRRAYGVKAGHAGTLDPMAQGVLLIFMDRALKLLQYIPATSLDKTYLMRVTLGTTTDTYDATGKTMAVHEGPMEFGHDEILTRLRRFVGTIKQRPPAFSAIKVKGKRAYDLARAGAPPELEARDVHVTSIRLVRDYKNETGRQLVLRIHCSRGTYVRSIAHDLGAALGCGGHLSYLLRERVGAFSHLHAFPFWKVQQKLPYEGGTCWVPMSEVLPHSKLYLIEGADARVKAGQSLEPKDVKSLKAAPSPVEGDPVFQVYSAAGEFIALYQSRSANETVAAVGSSGIPGSPDSPGSSGATGGGNNGAGRDGRGLPRLVPLRVLI
ncbi:MAG: tRNA pseudouridine(55) synthase TruB [Candidatus Ozemobacteraceae bacterium]